MVKIALQDWCLQLAARKQQSRSKIASTVSQLGNPVLDVRTPMLLTLEQRLTWLQEHPWVVGTRLDHASAPCYKKHEYLQ